jgi:putative transposase
MVRVSRHDMNSHREQLPKHRPPHDVNGGDAIFLTASTLNRVPHLDTPSRRDDFLELLSETCSEFSLGLSAWVILKEHYHLIVVPEVPERFSRWIGALHARSAARCNREDGTPGRQVWYQYWETSLWTQGDLWSRVNYIHGNPVKHGYVADPADWQWSSYLVTSDWFSDAETATLLCRFPAPRKLPNDDF